MEIRFNALGVLKPHRKDAGDRYYRRRSRPGSGIATLAEYGAGRQGGHDDHFSARLRGRSQ